MAADGPANTWYLARFLDYILFFLDFWCGGEFDTALILIWSRLCLTLDPVTWISQPIRSIGRETVRRDLFLLSTDSSPRSVGFWVDRTNPFSISIFLFWGGFSNFRVVLDWFFIFFVTNTFVSILEGLASTGSIKRPASFE